jgi:hypothetical protein
MRRRAFLRWSSTIASGALGTLTLPASMRAEIAGSIDVALPSSSIDVARDEAYWGIPSKTVADRLREQYRVNVQSKAGRPYKPFPEAVRVTPQPYTTLRELDRFVGAVISLATT